MIISGVLRTLEFERILKSGTGLAWLEMDSGALAIQVAGGATWLLYSQGLIVGDEERIDLDDRIDLVAVLVIRGVLETDSLDAGVVVIPGGTHAYALHAPEFRKFCMPGNLVALDDDYPLDRNVLGLVACVNRRAFFFDSRASRDRQSCDDDY